MIPRMRERAVPGRFEVIATFSPTSELTSVDLPTLGRPTTATKPDFTKPCWAPDGPAVESLHPHLRHPASLDPERGESGPGRGEHLTFLWHSSRQPENQPANRVPLVVGEVDPDELAEVGHREPAIDPPTAVLLDLDERHLDVVLVDDLTDKLLQQVLEGDQPAVPPNSSTTMAMCDLVACISRSNSATLVLGDEVGRAHHRGDGGSQLASVDHRQQVFGITDADHVVGVVTDHGTREKPLRPASPSGRRWWHRADHHHVGPGHHHLAHQHRRRR